MNGRTTESWNKANLLYSSRIVLESHSLATLCLTHDLSPLQLLKNYKAYLILLLFPLLLAPFEGRLNFSISSLGASFGSGKTTYFLASSLIVLVYTTTITSLILNLPFFFKPEAEAEMGLALSRFVKMLFARKEMRILMVGLDAAGKTTILYKLKLGEIVTTIPTIGIYFCLLLRMDFDHLVSNSHC